MAFQSHSAFYQRRPSHSIAFISVSRRVIIYRPVLLLNYMSVPSCPDSFLPMSSRPFLSHPDPSCSMSSRPLMFHSVPSCSTSSRLLTQIPVASLSFPFYPFPSQAISSRFAHACLFQFHLLPSSPVPFSFASNSILFCYILFSLSQSNSRPFLYYQIPPHPLVICMLNPTDQNTRKIFHVTFVVYI